MLLISQFTSFLILGSPKIKAIDTPFEFKYKTASGTLTRNYYPITLNNDSAPLIWSMLDNLHVDNMRVAYYDGSEWILVPFQLDEKGYVRTLIYTAGFQADFTLLGGPVQEADLCNYGRYQAIKRYLGKDIDASPDDDYREQTKYECELGFWDTINVENWIYDPDFAPPSEPIFNETIDLPQNPHCIDYDDELYFYAYNGNQVSRDNWWNEEIYPNRFEIEINDPIDGGQTWMYLYYNKDESIPINEDHYFIPTTGPHAGADYINWDPSNLTASGINYDYSYNLSNIDISSINVNSIPIINEGDKQYISMGFSAALNYLGIINYNINVDDEIWEEGTWDGLYYDEIKSYIGYGITMDLDLPGIEDFPGQDNNYRNAHDYNGYYDDRTHGNIYDTSKSYIIPPFINFPDIIKADSADHDGNTSEIVPFARGKLDTSNVNGEAAIDGPCRVIINKYNVRVTGFNVDAPVNYEEFYLVTNMESWFSANMMGDFETELSMNFTFGESGIEFEYQIFVHFAYIAGQQYTSEFISDPYSYVMFGQAPAGENGLPTLPRCYEGTGKVWPLKCHPDGIQGTDEYLIGNGPVIDKYDNDPINPSSEDNPLSDWAYAHYNTSIGGVLTYIPYQEFKPLFTGGSDGKADLSTYWADSDITEYSIYGNDANINGATKPFEKIVLFADLEGTSDSLTDINCKREYARMKIKLSDNLIITEQEFDLIPNINFIADKTMITVGDTVVFTLLGILGNEPLTFDWDFGDGITSHIADPTHMYTVEGNYSVSITVTDGDNQEDTEIKSNYIIVKNKTDQGIYTPLPHFPPNIGEIIIGLTIIFSGGAAIALIIFYTGKVRTKRKRDNYIHRGS
ncbi:MAG: PKD domain-containing protein [Promethearchaeota archaeon]